MLRFLRQASNFRTLALLAPLALALAACAPHKPTQSGFLTEAPVTATETAYTAALIDPVEFRPVGRTPDSVKPEDVAALTAAYEAELRAAFGKRFTLVDKPGPGVLRVRAAITGYTLANPAWNAVSLAVPIGPRNGGISTEAEVLDSRSGQLLASLSQGFNGHIWNSKPGDMFDRDGHAQSGFRQHAQALVEELPL